MKTIFLLPILMVLMSFSQCDGKKFDEKPPSKIVTSHFQNWVGGQPGSKGVLVTIKMEKLTDNIVFDSIYFNNKVEKLMVAPLDNEFILTGNFAETNPKRKDVVLSGNPKEEFGNQPPKIEKNLPFKLNENEAIISYLIKGKKRYYLLKNIKKSKPIYYQ